MSSDPISVEVDTIEFLKAELAAGNDVRNNATALISYVLTSDDVDIEVKLAKRPASARRFRVTLEEVSEPAVTISMNPLEINTEGAGDPSRVAKLVLAEFEKLAKARRE